ncbi:unnamed protein product [Rotaria socialis]|uniref:AAA+ ATPase domain-containing protein n=1 Tax=Rotaria socialis TaxID=392032 RepID=A0A817XBL9_9BILA|nr:unnamed protein product [Rotaria socialis]CAF4655507.1 unnamed protein product [Rotaria socialis]
MNSEDVASIILSSNYSGACDHTPLTNEGILKLTDQQSIVIYGPTLFALKYRVLPCTVNPKIHRSTDYVDVSTFNSIGQGVSFARGRQWSSKRKQGGMYHATSAINFITNEYKLDRNRFIYDWSYDASDKSSLISTVYIDLGNYLSVQFSGGSISPTNIDNPNALEPDHETNIFHCFTYATIFHVPQTADRARTLFEQLSKFKLFPITTATLQMVCHDAQNGFYTSSIRMNQPRITDLKLHYGDEFEIIHEQLLETLQEKDSTGITFLHGPPGTGKTYYLRYLINEIKDKSLIYVPPDLVNDMTKPGFLPFLMKHPNSILIIEDAENIIRDRIQDNFLPNQAVANLLNLSDGLLGDAMHQQIICTFNCDVKGIDPALLRDGRLVIEHKFDKLNVQNARRMCVELGLSDYGNDIHEPISLSEIYARKNNTEADLANGHTTKNNRTLKKRNQKVDPFLGFYS